MGKISTSIKLLNKKQRKFKSSTTNSTHLFKQDQYHISSSTNIDRSSLSQFNLSLTSYKIISSLCCKGHKLFFRTERGKNFDNLEYVEVYDSDRGTWFLVVIIIIVLTCFIWICSIKNKSHELDFFWTGDHSVWYSIN